MNKYNELHENFRKQVIDTLGYDITDQIPSASEMLKFDTHFMSVKGNEFIWIINAIHNCNYAFVPNKPELLSIFETALAKNLTWVFIPHSLYNQLKFVFTNEYKQYIENDGTSLYLELKNCPVHDRIRVNFFYYKGKEILESSFPAGDIILYNFKHLIEQNNFIPEKDEVIELKARKVFIYYYEWLADLGKLLEQGE